MATSFRKRTPGAFRRSQPLRIVNREPLHLRKFFGHAVVRVLWKRFTFATAQGVVTTPPKVELLRAGNGSISL